MKSKYKSILIICGASIREKIAGAGKRSLEVARCLANNNRVDVLIPNSDPPKVEDINFISMSKIKLDYDIVISQSPAEKAFIRSCAFRKLLARSSKYYDLYCPTIFEALEKHKNKRKKYLRERLLIDIERINLMLELGDYFLCGNERQRKFYVELADQIGKRINIDIVPFGISSEAPLHNKAVLKGVIPGINEGDKVILWWGGIWSWYDPDLLIRAMSAVKNIDRRIKLFFASSNPPVRKTRIFDDTHKRVIELSKRLNLYGKNVFFADDWIDYSDRGNYLLEADAGIVIQLNTLETFFSCRARIYDYIWAGLPIIMNEGDTFSELVETKSLGIVHKGGDAGKLAQDIVRLFKDKAKYETYKMNIEKMKISMYWEKALEPLTAYIGNMATKTKMSFTEAFRMYFRIFRYFIRLARFFIGNWNAIEHKF